MLSREHMVDESHPWRTQIVLIAKISTAEQLNPGGAEIAGRNGRNAGGEFAARRFDPIVDLEIHVAR
jgi:hypothetical protein